MSLWMLGMAKALKGNQEATLPQLAQAMEKGVELIMKRTGSKPGEKTVLDALCPAVETLNRLSETGDWNQALSAAADAAVAGSEKTRQMLAVHGRASYYGEKSLGVIDGGSVVGGMIFTVLRDYGITVTGGDAH